MKKAIYFLLGIIVIVFVSACSNKNENSSKALTIWSWNVAGKGLKATIKSFSKKYPEVKVNIIDIGGNQVRDKLTIGLASGAGLPDIIQVESQYMETFCGKFPQGFVDLTSKAEKYVKDFDQSKWPQSKIDEKIRSIPWDSGPVAVFYRRDFFEKAGVNAEDIKTWNDYIKAGIKIQEANPYVKMLTFDYSNDDSLFRILLNQQGTFYFDKNGEIALESEKALKALELIKKLVDSGLTTNNNSWDNLIRNGKNGIAATIISGVWWGGTMKDQMPELSGKWGVFKLPAFAKGESRAANLGGSTLAISSQSKNKKLAWEFIKNALINKKNQLLMFRKYSLFPSYIPVYKSKDFNQKDIYFGGQKVNKLFAEITKVIPKAYYSSDFSLANRTVINAKASTIIEDVPPKKALTKVSNRLKIFTGRKIAYDKKFQEVE